VAGVVAALIPNTMKTPTLRGVIGRVPASEPGVDYSPALNT